MIISASRRTDIPAFFAEWFMNRICAGFVCIRNPINPKQVRKILLTSDAVDCIVFWTKNPSPLMPRLQELASFNYYFQFTLTPYNQLLEPRVPTKALRLQIFKNLSEQIGPKKIIWRYDPIILSPSMPVSFHVDSFTAMAADLRGYTYKCVISFLDMYKKCEKNLRGLNILPFTEKTMREIASSFAAIAAKNNLELVTCAEEIDLSAFGIAYGKCIDDKLIAEICGKDLSLPKDKTQRPLCGCITSVDIGAYNTCSHGCLYCYANSNLNAVKKNVLRHDPASALLLGNV